MTPPRPCHTRTRATRRQRWTQLTIEHGIGFLCGLALAAMAIDYGRREASPTPKSIPSHAARTLTTYPGP
jgi:ABC-type branched-subunit amino acid transport system ATPase component